MTAIAAAPADLNALNLHELADRVLRKALIALAELLDDPDANPETKRKAIADLLRHAARGIIPTTSPAPAKHTPDATPKARTEPQAKPAKSRPEPPPTPTYLTPPRLTPRDVNLVLNALTNDPSPVPPPQSNAEPPAITGSHKRPKSRYKKRRSR